MLSYFQRDDIVRYWATKIDIGCSCCHRTPDCRRPTCLSYLVIGLLPYTTSGRGSQHRRRRQTGSLFTPSLSCRAPGDRRRLNSFVARAASKTWRRQRSGARALEPEVAAGGVSRSAASSMGRRCLTRFLALFQLLLLLLGRPRVWEILNSNRHSDLRFA